MENLGHVPDHPKKRRRKLFNRRQLRSKEPISARLVLDHQVRGDTGLLSEDLVADLFPGLNFAGELFLSFIYPIVALLQFSNVATGVYTSQDEETAKRYCILLYRHGRG